MRNIQIKVYHTLLFISLNTYDSFIKQILFIISHFDFFNICSELKTNIDYIASGTLYTDIDDEIIQKLKKCSDEHKIIISDIIYAEAKLKGVSIYAKETNYNIKETMKQLRSMLTASCFAVPHNSYIVNMNYIKSFQRNEITLAQPYSDIKISVATRKQPEFKRRFLDFIGEDIDND